MASGKWEQQVVVYTGDGTAGRLVPTTFSLASGIVAVWVWPHSQSGVQQTSYRSSAMAGTLVVTNGAPPLKTLTGIMSLTASGFTVTDSPNGKVNSIGATYTALVFRDTTSDQRYMRVGTYTGNSTPRTITAGGTKQLTHMWILGFSGGAAYCSDEFPVGQSVNFEPTTTSLTVLITALGVGTFSVGNDAVLNDANAGGLDYYYTAFTIAVGDPVRSFFNTFNKLGTGGTVVVTGLGFTPAFAIDRAIAVAADPLWRSSTFVGTPSLRINDGAVIDPQGIRAFGSGTIDLGNLAAPAGVKGTGFAMASAGSVDIFVPPVVSVPEPKWSLQRFDIKPRSEQTA